MATWTNRSRSARHDGRPGAAGRAARAAVLAAVGLAGAVHAADGASAAGPGDDRMLEVLAAALDCRVPLGDPVPAGATAEAEASPAVPPPGRPAGTAPRPDPASFPGAARAAHHARSAASGTDRSPPASLMDMMKDASRLSTRSGAASGRPALPSPPVAGPAAGPRDEAAALPPPPALPLPLAARAPGALRATEFGGTLSPPAAVVPDGGIVAKAGMGGAGAFPGVLATVGDRRRDPTATTVYPSSFDPLRARRREPPSAEDRRRGMALLAQLDAAPPPGRNFLPLDRQRVRLRENAVTIRSALPGAPKNAKTP